MQRLCKTCREWHDLDEPWPCALPVRNSAPYVISDSMQPMRHMATGRTIDSKARFRAETKASGCIEIGNEPIRARAPIKLDRRQRREDIQRSIYHLRNKSVSR